MCLVIMQEKGKFKKDTVRKGVQEKFKHWSPRSSYGWLGGNVPFEPKGIITEGQNGGMELKTGCEWYYCLKYLLKN